MLAQPLHEWNELAVGRVFRAGIGINLARDLGDEERSTAFCQLISDLLGRFDGETIRRLDQLVDANRLASLDPPRSLYPGDIEVISSLVLAMLNGMLRTTAFDSPVFPNLTPRRNQVDID
jgi:hypothetical protein